MILISRKQSNLNFPLSIFTNSSSIESTTTIDANRKRYLSGIFLSQNYTSQGEHRPESINFAVRLINRNKAQTRTNKVSRSIAVVETVSHPIKGDTYSLTKLLRQSPMKPQSVQAQCAQKNISISPITWQFITQAVDNLMQCGTLLFLLRHHDLERLDAEEIKTALNGIETLLATHTESLMNRIEAVEKGGEK